jgi:hypothetical protein
LAQGECDGNGNARRFREVLARNPGGDLTYGGARIAWLIILIAATEHPGGRHDQWLELATFGQLRRFPNCMARA